MESLKPLKYQTHELAANNFKFVASLKNEKLDISCELSANRKLPRYFKPYLGLDGRNPVSVSSGFCEQQRH